MHLPDYFPSDVAATLGFGVMAILLVVAGYKVFDWLTPKLDFDLELKNKNVALAIVIAAFILGVCHVVAQVVSAVLGG